jgi:hypothetical protein
MLFPRSLRGALAATFCAAGIVSTAPAVEAAVMPTPAPQYALSDIQRTDGSCGPGRQQGLNGVCHSEGWFAYRRACPPGTHLGPYGRRCWPN